jgi:predicted membrane chloride channel (bestrophin family)
MVGVEMLAYYDIKIAFSPSGHGLMTLIISYLVVAKVNLSYDRYMNARHAIGHALASLRELNQISMTYTSRTNDVARQWRSEGTFKIIDLMDCTIRVIQDEKQAVFLARNEFSECKKKSADDPMLHVQALRLHLYKGCYVLEHPLELLEKMKLVDMLNEYVIHYRDLLKLASTPLPFPLLQMARTFLFLYTFTIPFVLRGVVDEAFVAMIFVFFLTYGFVGLELVAMKLMYPFGDGVNDLNVTGMRDVRWTLESVNDLECALRNN